MRSHRFPSTLVATAPPLLAAVLLLLPLVLLLLAALPAAALPPREEWVEVRTAHFTLIGNAGAGKTAEIGLALERFRQVLGRLGPSLELESPIPTTLIVFKNERSFAPYKRREDGRTENLTGFFLSHSQGGFIAMNAFPRRGEALPIVFHEYTHFFLRHNFPFLPLWANEGLAEYYSTFDELAGEALIGAPVGHHIETLQARSMIPLDRLFAVETNSAEYNEEEKKGIFYAQSWALIHYLLTGDDERRQGAVELLTRLSAGEDAATAVRQSLGLTLTELEGRLLGTVRARRFPFFRIPAGDFPSPSGYQVRPLPREEVLFHLGDLLAHGGPELAGEAREHFREARMVNPRYPEALRGLSLLAREEGRDEEAETLLEQAVELGSREARTYALYGDLLLDRLREERLSPTLAAASPLWRQARELLLTARKLDPSFAEVEALLGSTWFYDPNGASEGISHLALALNRLPDRPDIAYNLAMLYVKTGDLDGARRVVARNLVPSGRADLAREANEAIERNRLVQAANAASTRGDAERAVELYREAMSLTTDPAMLVSMEGQLRRLEELAATNAQIERYNRAVEMANRGRLREALRELRSLRPRIRDENLRRSTESLIRDLERALP